MLQSAVPERKRQKPVCLFINYLGCRQGSSQQQVIDTAKDKPDTSKTIIPKINCAAPDVHPVVDLTAEVTSPNVNVAAADARPVIDLTAEATSPSEQKSPLPFYRLMCPCKLKFPVHLTNLDKPTEKKEDSFDAGIPVHLNNLKLSTCKPAVNSLSSIQVALLSATEDLDSSETRRGESSDVASEPCPKKQKVV